MKKLFSLVLAVMLLLSVTSLATAEGDWICTACGRVNDDAFAFCPACGGGRDELPVCPACGFEMTEDMAGFAFCPKCGADMKGNPDAEKEPVYESTGEILLNVGNFYKYFILDVSLENSSNTYYNINGSKVYIPSAEYSVSISPRSAFTVKNASVSCAAKLNFFGYPTVNNEIGFTVDIPATGFATKKQTRDNFGMFAYKIDNELKIFSSTVTSASGILVLSPEEAEAVNAPLYEKAKKLEEEGKFDQAKPIWEQLAEVHYRDAAACLDAMYDRAYRTGLALMDEGNYQNAIASFEAANGFSDSKEQIRNCENAIRQEKYNEAVELMEAGNYERAITAFTALGSYGDSRKQIQNCENAIQQGKYDAAVALMEEGKYERAITAFTALGNYGDSKQQIINCENAILQGKYDKAKALMEAGNYDQAMKAFAEIEDFSDAKQQIEACRNTLDQQDFNAAKALMDEGRYEEAIVAFSLIIDQEGSEQQIIACHKAIKDNAYNEAVTMKQNGRFPEAMEAFRALGDYRDAAENATDCAATVIAAPDDTGDVVQLLLEKACDMGFIKKTEVGETYTNKLATSIKAMEKALGLKADGNITAEEYAVITTVVYPGMTGSDAARLMECLYELGGMKGELPNEHDTYAKAQATAVKTLEKKYGLTADSYVTQEELTLLELISLDYKAQKDAFRTVGSVVTYGSYEQDGDTGNGKEPIEWVVLEWNEKTNETLLISRGALDAVQFQAETKKDRWPDYPTWAKSDIRKWLNGAFLKDAFTAAQQKGLVKTKIHTAKVGSYDGGADSQDLVWLLSVDEVEKYMPDQESRMQIPSAYARPKCTLDGWNWLRSPGSNSNYASLLMRDGKIYSNSVKLYCYVRPVCKVKLSVLFGASGIIQTMTTADVREQIAAYEAGITNMEQGNYEAAIAGFENANGMKDSNDLILKCRFLMALELMSRGDMPAGVEQLRNLGDYPPVRELLDSNKELNKKIKEWSMKPGAKVTFGHFEQDMDLSNGAEPIEWQVLEHDEKNKRVLLISRYGLAPHAFHPGDDNTLYPTWEKSDVRAWLNSTFMNAAFTAQEQKYLIQTKITTPANEGTSGGADTQDKVWLLSYEEAEKYFTDDAERAVVPTVYAVASGAYQYKDKDPKYIRDGRGCGQWLLRSPGMGNKMVSGVNFGGGLYRSFGVYNNAISVRPAIWVDQSALDY